MTRTEMVCHVLFIWIRTESCVTHSSMQTAMATVLAPASPPTETALAMGLRRTDTRKAMGFIFSA